jgi:hypothetical protein
MKTVKQCMVEVQEAWCEYDAALECWGSIQENYVMKYVRQIWQTQAELEWVLLREERDNLRVEVNTLGGEVNTLKDANLELSEAHSAAHAEGQRLTAQNTALVADKQRLKDEAEREARNRRKAEDIADELAKTVDALRSGADETRTELDKVLEALEIQRTGKGTTADLNAAEKAIKNLWALVHTSKTQPAPAPEVQAVIDKIAGSRGLKALAVPTDNITLATIRAWWAITTEEKRRADAYSVLSEIILPAHERGTTWIGVLWSLRDADVTIGELPMNVGKTGKVDRISAVSARKVTVGTEERGPEWGEGRAAAQFEALRQENARTPLGKRTEHDLKNNIIPLRPESADDLPKAN